MMNEFGHFILNENKKMFFVAGERIIIIQQIIILYFTLPRFNGLLLLALWLNN